MVNQFKCILRVFLNLNGIKGLISNEWLYLIRFSSIWTFILLTMVAILAAGLKKPPNFPCATRLRFWLCPLKNWFLISSVIGTIAGLSHRGPNLYSQNEKICQFIFGFFWKWNFLIFLWNFPIILTGWALHMIFLLFPHVNSLLQ